MAAPAENLIYVYPNKFHKPGDKNPCLKPYGDETIKVVCPGCGGVHDFQVAIWAPKEGKKGYFLRLSEPRNKQQGQNQQSAEQSQSQQPSQTQQQKPPEDRKSLLR
jgi:hypothetical protein